MAEPIEAFRFPTGIDIGRGEISKERDYAKYISELIRQVLLTAPGERVNLPDFGAGLRNYVFSNINDSTASLVQTAIFQSLDRWLGNLISVDEVKVSSDQSTLSVNVKYTLKARGNQELLNLEVTS